MTVLLIKDLEITFLTGFTHTTPITILNKLSINLQQGEIYGFLGINGAGKTTTLEAIMGFLTPQSGNITFFNKHPLNNIIRKKIGYAPDKTPYFEFLTGRENVMTIAKYSNIDKTTRESLGNKLFDKLELSYAKNNYVQHYSQGMKQRLGLILSLINDPEIVIWDEPMSGLDPLGRIVVKNLMKDLQSQGKSIIFSTHILSDVQEIADRFGILDGGTMLYEGSPKNLPINLEQFFHDTLLHGQSIADANLEIK